MTIRLSRAEYWLLDAVVEYNVSISDLISGDAAGELNKSDHHCTAEELADALDRLFTDRFITSFPFGIDFPRKSRRRYKFLTRPEIEAELHRPKLPLTSSDRGLPTGRHPDEKFYHLTPLGGAAWESFAHPDWSIFIEGVGVYRCFDPDTDPRRPNQGCAICPTRRWIERYLECAHHIGHHVDKAFIRWDVLSPWKATYWKTLPTAHRARYTVTYHPESRSPLDSDVYNLSHCWYRWRS